MLTTRDFEVVFRPLCFSIETLMLYPGNNTIIATAVEYATGDDKVLSVPDFNQPPQSTDFVGD